MRLLIHDFAGHPFAAELSRALARRGYDVIHAYCGGVTTGRGALETAEGDPPGLRFRDVSDAPFERYSPMGRLRSEVAYGRQLAALVEAAAPDAVLSANCPLESQRRLWVACRRVGARRVFWLQDFLGRGTRAVLHERSPLLGRTAGRAWERFETALLRGADAIVAISPDFVGELDRRAVRGTVSVIENWTPVREVTVRPKENPWSRAHGLAERPVALYSGTLGLKHDPEHLVVAAQALADDDSLVVVASEGLGRDHLERRRKELGLENLVLLDFVAYDDLPDVLGAADVALVLLEPDAGSFSAPSKVLTYLAAGRAVVGAVPAANLATRTVERAGAGIIVAPGAREAFADAVRSLLLDPTRRGEMGAAARSYAVEHFAIEPIADEFQAILDPG
jgi:glycosyltransferase involved in cell wall biosynthesis